MNFYDFFTDFIFLIGTIDVVVIGVLVGAIAGSRLMMLVTLISFSANMLANQRHFHLSWALGQILQLILLPFFRLHLPC